MEKNMETLWGFVRFIAKIMLSVLGQGRSLRLWPFSISAGLGGGFRNAQQERKVLTVMQLAKSACATSDGLHKPSWI